MCGPILWSIKWTQNWVRRPNTLVHEIHSKLGPPTQRKNQPKTKSSFANFVFRGSVGQGRAIAVARGRRTGGEQTLGNAFLVKRWPQIWPQDYTLFCIQQWAH